MKRPAFTDFPGIYRPDTSHQITRGEKTTIMSQKETEIKEKQEEGQYVSTKIGEEAEEEG